MTKSQPLGEVTFRGGRVGLPPFVGCGLSMSENVQSVGCFVVRTDGVTDGVRGCFACNPARLDRGSCPNPSHPPVVCARGWGMQAGGITDKTKERKKWKTKGRGRADRKGVSA